MRQAIRALGWATNIFWIILLFFTVTAVYSAFQIRPGFGQPYTNTSDGTMIASLPFYIDNGGFYDITNVNLTTLVKDNGGLPISGSSTFVRAIPRGSNVSVTHNMTISINQMTTESLSYLLFNDSNLEIDIALKLDYADAVPFKISTNSIVPWGAPLSNLTIGKVSASPYNATHFRVIVPVDFENHSPFSLDGTMRLELTDNNDHLLVSGRSSIPAQGGSVPIEVFVSDPTSIRKVRLSFATSIFNYGPVVIPIHV